MSEEPIVVRQMSAVMPVSAEQLTDALETKRAVDAWMAMTPEERLASSRARDAERMAAKEAAEAEARRFLDWLRAAVAPSPFAEAHMEIIDEHGPIDGSFYSEARKVCGTCATTDLDGDIEGDPYPCVTLRALAKAYGWSP